MKLQKYLCQDLDCWLYAGWGIVPSQDYNWLLSRLLLIVDYCWLLRLRNRTLSGLDSLRLGEQVRFERWKSLFKKTKKRKNRWGWWWEKRVLHSFMIMRMTMMIIMDYVDHIKWSFRLAKEVIHWRVTATPFPWEASMLRSSSATSSPSQSSSSSSSSLGQSRPSGGKA